MPVAGLKTIVRDAFDRKYAVAAINVFNVLTLEAVLAAALETNAPVIVQTSVKTVRSVGRDVLFAVWTATTTDITVPVSLRLDHCPDRRVISDSLRAGWNSVLFDRSHLPPEENPRQIVEVVAAARLFGARVEGELEAITGVDDDIGTDEEGIRQSLDVQVEFVRRGGVHVFAPAIGNATGSTAARRSWTRNASLTSSRRQSISVVLHGGSGLTDAQFTELIQRGCAKGNISTALKGAYLRAALSSLQDSPRTDAWDPATLFWHTRAVCPGVGCRPHPALRRRRPGRVIRAHSHLRL